MRRILVNAQVTAMISFIEFVFFFGHVVGISVAGGTSPEVVIIVLVMYLILYGVIAPYSFLMNSSHNKNRIVEHGWINVVMNVTTNNSISKSYILLDCCKEERNNNASDNVFSIRNHLNKEINISSRNLASLDQPSHERILDEHKRPPKFFPKPWHVRIMDVKKWFLSIQTNLF